MFRTLILALALSLALGGTALAAEKIGAVNIMAVTGQSAPGKAAEKELETRFGAERQQLEKQAADFNKKVEDFNKQASALSEKARAEKGADLERQARELDEKTRTYTQRLGDFQNALSTQLQEIVNTASKTLGKDGKYDMIIDGAVVLYGVDSVNLTEALIKEVDAVWKAKGSKFANLPAAKK